MHRAGFLKIARGIFCLFALITGAEAAPTTPADPVREFSGTGSATTDFFTAPDRWEVCWNARRVVSVAVMSPDGAIVAGGAGVLRGSLFLPLGGRYYLKINDDNAPPSDPGPAWHVQVVPAGAAPLTVYSPYFVPPDVAVSPAPPPPPEPKLSEAQTRALVLVKGDEAEGGGFLFKTAEGTFVATRLHLLAANPNVKVFTAAGAPVQVLALKGAADRDVALFTVRDDHYAYLSPPDDLDRTVPLGEAVIVPHLGPESELMLGATGKLVGLGAGRIDFDAELDSAHLGGPVIDGKSGRVLALADRTEPADLSATLARAWPDGVTSPSYFGWRLDDVKNWETYDPARFLAETLFLRKFHLETRCLDSYLHGHKPSPHWRRREPGAADPNLYLTNEKLRTAGDRFNQLAGDADRNQRFDAERELLFDLGTFADTGVKQLEGGFYAYNQARAKEELAYRRALRKEIEDFGGNLPAFDAVIRDR